MLYLEENTAMDEEVESRFVCPICCEVLKVPTMVEKCGHRYVAFPSVNLYTITFFLELSLLTSNHRNVNIVSIFKLLTQVLR